MSEERGTEVEARERAYFDEHYHDEACHPVGLDLRFRRELASLQKAWGDRPLGRVLSIGCGQGGFDRSTLARHAPLKVIRTDEIGDDRFERRAVFICITVESKARLPSKISYQLKKEKTGVVGPRKEVHYSEHDRRCGLITSALQFRTQAVVRKIRRAYWQLLAADGSDRVRLAL